MGKPERIFVNLCVKLRGFLRFHFWYFSLWYYWDLQEFVGWILIIQRCAIIIEQFLRRWRLGQLNNAYRGTFLTYNFHNIIENAYYHWIFTKTQFYEHLVVEWCIFKYAFSYITLRILNLYNRRSKIFAIHISGLKYCLHPYMPW